MTFKKGHLFLGGGFPKGQKRIYAPKPWNKTKKGTFKKGHIVSNEQKKKQSNTIMTKYTSEQRSEKARKAAMISLMKPCNRAFTKIELAMQEALALINIQTLNQFRLSNFSFDLAIPHQNIMIECDGDYWHSLPNNKKADINKQKYCNDNNITLLRFKEKDIKQNIGLCINKVIEATHGRSI